MTDIRKFERGIVLTILAVIVWTVAVFSPDVAVDETAITQLVIVVIAVIAAGGSLADIVLAIAIYLAKNYDLARLTQASLDAYEDKTGKDIDDGLEGVIVGVVKGAESQLEKDAPTPVPDPVAKG